MMDEVSPEDLSQFMKGVNEELMGFVMKMQENNVKMMTEFREVQQRIFDAFLAFHAHHPQALSKMFAQDPKAFQDLHPEKLYQQVMDQWKAMLPDWTKQFSAKAPPEHLWKEYWDKWKLKD